jgi:hypothetical protein
MLVSDVHMLAKFLKLLGTVINWCRTNKHSLLQKLLLSLSVSVYVELLLSLSVSVYVELLLSLSVSVYVELLLSLSVSVYVEAETLRKELRWN